MNFLKIFTNSFAIMLLMSFKDSSCINIPAKQSQLVLLDKSNVQQFISFGSYDRHDVESVVDDDRFKVSLALVEMLTNKNVTVKVTKIDGGEVRIWDDDEINNQIENITGKYVIDGSKAYSIEFDGNKSDINGLVIATIYYDVDSCDACTSAHKCNFCCNSSGNNGTGSACVAEVSKCNFPNCGGNYCQTNDDCYFCTDSYGFPCGFNYWTIMLMTSMAITFLILVPAIVAFLFCYKRELSRARRLRPGPNGQRVRMGRDIVTVNSPPDDLPPKYDDVHEINEPPPCFCAAVINPTVHNGNGNTGVDNPQFVSDFENDSPVLHSARAAQANCTCQKEKKNEDVKSAEK